MEDQTWYYKQAKKGIEYPLCKDCTIIEAGIWCQNKSIHKMDQSKKWTKENTQIVLCFFNQIVKVLPDFESFKKQPNFFNKFQEILTLVQTDPDKARQMAQEDIKLQELQAKKPDQPQDPIELAKLRKEKGNAYYKSKKYEESVYCYENAIKLNPLEMIYYTNKAAALTQLQKYNDALKLLMEALQKYSETDKDPKKLNKIYFRTARIYEVKGKYQMAVEYFEKCLDLNNKDKNIIKCLQKVKKQLVGQLQEQEKQKKMQEQEKGKRNENVDDEMIKQNPDKYAMCQFVANQVFLDFENKRISWMKKPFYEYLQGTLLSKETKIKQLLQIKQTEEIVYEEKGDNTLCYVRGVQNAYNTCMFISLFTTNDEKRAQAKEFLKKFARKDFFPKK